MKISTFTSTIIFPTSIPKFPIHHHQTPLQTLTLISSPPRLPTSQLAPKPNTTVSPPMAGPTTASTETKPFAVLFVCLGNICRSPAAEGVFRELVRRKGLEEKFEIDSAGTINYHEGNPADARMRLAAKRRHVEITSISRPIKPSDFKHFDLILAMDKQNRSDILEAFDRWKEKYKLPADAYKKVKLMCSYCKKHDEDEVPDPYYGGPQGFEKAATAPAPSPEPNRDYHDGNLHGFLRD
ncbi:hypothetical protein Droror1_Dr00003161 [Drosera rotundifolia]